MKKLIISILFFLLSANIYAQEKAKVLLVTFKAQSEKQITYLTESISEIISSKLGKDSILKLYDGIDTDQNKILEYAKREKFDFVISGVLKIEDREYILDGALYSLEQKRRIVFLNQNGVGTGTIFVHVTDFADKILELGLKKEKEKSSFVKVQNNKSWKSEAIDFEVTSISTCDYNGDGKNELVISSLKEIFIFKKDGDTLKKLAGFDPDTRFKIYGVEAIDLNKNGRDEIFVTALNKDENRLNSFIMEWDGEKFEKIVKNQNYHYRLINMNGEKTLLTQEAGHIGPANYGFERMDYAEELYKLVWDNGYIKDRIKKHEGTQIYSSIINDINKELKNVKIIFEKDDHIKVLSEKDNVLWISGEPLGGSDKYFKITSKYDPEIKENVYFSQRLFFDDIDNDGNKELITVKNENQTTYLPNSRSYNKASILVLSWGATGFETKYQSSKYSGYISDFYVGDIDNDGKKEIVYAVVTKDGFFSGKKSVIYTYNLY